MKDSDVKIQAGEAETPLTELGAFLLSEAGAEIRDGLDIAVAYLTGD